ncbi:MAG: hypothetical protein JWM10_759 [Myxococcaceae bacterium]|nr:hypothetical protein [Myxococcaceae bacterium]
MHRWLAEFRGLLGREDGRAAYAAEQRATHRASAPVEIDPGFREAMSAITRSGEDHLTLGRSARDPTLAVSLRTGEIAGAGHVLVLGTSGAGKTRTVAGLARQLLARIAHAPDAQGLVVMDHKGELVSIVRGMMGEIADGLPPAEARRFLDRLVVVNPFSTEALVPLQILRCEPGDEPELVALEATSVIDRLGGAQLGVNQDAFLFHTLLLGVDRGLSLPEVADLLGDPARIAAYAARSGLDAVRSFFGGERRLSEASLQGVRSRLHRLCRMRSARLMLGARDAVSFYEMLRSRIVLIDLGSPPFGCEDLAAFWAGILTLKLTRAIFQRTDADRRRPVTILVDEWQEGLAAGGGIAQHYARVLSVARSRAVSLVLISQSLAGAARIESTLPEVVATNTSVQLLFRASAADARAMAHLLPVTGRRARPPVAPWEERPKSPFLDRQAEREALVAEIPSLPQRTLYFWNRHHSPRAELVRSLDVELPRARQRTAAIAWLLRNGALARPLAALEAELARVGEPDFRARGASPIQPTTPSRPPPPAAPRRPARRPRFR